MILDSYHNAIRLMQVPTDVLYTILQLLDPIDILTLRQVSEEFLTIELVVHG